MNRRAWQAAAAMLLLAALSVVQCVAVDATFGPLLAAARQDLARRTVVDGQFVHGQFVDGRLA